MDDETDVKILLDGEVRKDIAALRHVADAAAGAGVRWQLVDALAVEDDRAGADGEHAGDGFQRGGLAHAVAAHECNDLAGVNFKGHAAQDAGTTDVRLNCGNLEECAHRVPCLPRPR